MMLHFPEGMRNKVFPLTTKWFEKVMNSPEAVKAYGRTVLCKNPVKAFTGEIGKQNQPEEKKECDKKNESNNQKKEKGNKKENHKENQKENHKEKNKENKNENKKENKKDKNEKAKALKSAPIVKAIEKKPYVPSMLELPRFHVKKKENNPLDALPPSTFNLENFKNDFINHSNKADAMLDFWKNYDPSGFSIWHIEYNNEPNEFITLFRTVIKKGDILLQLKYFKPYCFGVLGVYGSDGDYKISGCMVWRGQEIPDEMKDVVCFKKLKFRKLNENEKSDKELVFDYWTKIDEKESVCGRQAIDTRYFY
jgi:elongation factor 1-gamma